MDAGAAAGGGTVLYGRRAMVPPHVLARSVHDELVVLSLESEQYYALDATGARMWELLTTKPTVEDAVADLLEEYEVDEATLRQDLEELVRQLQELNLLDLVDADGPK